MSISKDAENIPDELQSTLRKKQGKDGTSFNKIMAVDDIWILIECCALLTRELRQYRENKRTKI